MISKGVHIGFYESGGNFFIIINDEKFKCPYSEYAILRILVENKGAFYSNEQLIALGWPERIVSPNSVPVAITNLRKMFKNHTPSRIIENIKNKGYTINKPQVIFDSGLSASNNDVHSPKETETETETVTNVNESKGYINRFLKFPLLIINLILFIYLGYTRYDFIDNVENEVDIASNSSAVIISSRGTNIGKLSNTFENKDGINFSDIEAELVKLEYLNKSIVFFSDYGRKIIIDCVVGDNLYSYSGNDLEKIVSDLNKDGCKL